MEEEGATEIVEKSPGERYIRFAERLGSGASKDVYRAYDTEEGVEVAWNVVSLVGVAKSERNRIVNEVQLLQKLHHPNIISFHGSWVNRERQQVHFITEILSSGTLKSFVSKVQMIRWKIAKRWAIQILEGLQYLHGQGVIHRDLKCDNIFINGTSGDLRIGDFGLSRIQRSNEPILSVLGTPEFMAPDLYNQIYDEKVDIYSFGMCMLEIFTKEIPYKECDNPAQIYKRVMDGEYPLCLYRIQNDEAREFITYCLGRQEAGKYIRPTASELLKHPFLETKATDTEIVLVDPPGTTALPTISEMGKDMPKVVPMDSGSTIPTSLSTLASDKLESIDMARGNVSAGRGKALAEDDSSSFLHQQQLRQQVKHTQPQLEQKLQQQQQLQQQLQQQQLQQQQMQQQQQFQQQHLQHTQQQRQIHRQVQKQEQRYLLAAAVLVNNEDHAKAREGSLSLPGSTEGMLPSSAKRPDINSNLLKLVVTLPINGEAQNVQFDYSLINDDPVQVAREMVQEFGMPTEAILEISETISNLVGGYDMAMTEQALAQQKRSPTVINQPLLPEEQSDQHQHLHQQLQQIQREQLEQLQQPQQHQQQQHPRQSVQRQEKALGQLGGLPSDVRSSDFATSQQQVYQKQPQQGIPIDMQYQGVGHQKPGYLQFEQQQQQQQQQQQLMELQQAEQYKSQQMAGFVPSESVPVSQYQMSHQHQQVPIRQLPQTLSGQQPGSMLQSGGTQLSQSSGTSQSTGQSSQYSNLPNVMQLQQQKQYKQPVQQTAQLSQSTLLPQQQQMQMQDMTQMNLQQQPQQVHIIPQQGEGYIESQLHQQQKQMQSPLNVPPMELQMQSQLVRQQALGSFPLANSPAVPNYEMSQESMGQTAAMPRRGNQQTVSISQSTTSHQSRIAPQFAHTQNPLIQQQQSHTMQQTQPAASYGRGQLAQSQEMQHHISQPQQQQQQQQQQRHLQQKQAQETSQLVAQMGQHPSQTVMSQQATGRTQAQQSSIPMYDQPVDQPVNPTSLVANQPHQLQMQQDQLPHVIQDAKPELLEHVQRSDQQAQSQILQQGQSAQKIAQLQQQEQQQQG